MKVQMRGQELRFRIDEDELASLLDGGEVQDVTRVGPDDSLLRSVVLHDGPTPEFAFTPRNWRLRLPGIAVRAHAARLPCRDALAFDLPGDGDVALAVRLEVDVRDSLRVRGAKRRSERD